MSLKQFFWLHSLCNRAWVFALPPCLNSLSKFTGLPPFFKIMEKRNGCKFWIWFFSLLELAASSVWKEKSWEYVKKISLYDGSWVFKGDTEITIKLTVYNGMLAFIADLKKMVSLTFAQILLVAMSVCQ